MAIPDFQSLMLPALAFVAEKGPEVPVRELSASLAREFGLTEQELRTLLPSGRAPQFYNRVQWAAFHLRKAGLLSSPRRAHLTITQRGREVLGRKLPRVDLRLLAEFPEFRSFRAANTRARGERAEASAEAETADTPLEALLRSYQSLRDALATDLLDRTKTASPEFFEQLVVELLVKMGYGGSRQDAGKALGRSGDEGIDGIIKEDKLGLDVIYIQAKRWKDKSVGRPEIQQFAGALAGQGAQKGIFLTTSRFTDDARNFVGKVNSKIVLIDGEELAELMIDHGVGVTTDATYEVKRVDSDYFAEQGE